MHPCSFRMSNHQPQPPPPPPPNGGPNSPYLKLDAPISPVDLYVQFFIWNNDENLRNLVRYLTGAERVDRLLPPALANNGGGGGGGGGGGQASSGHLQSPPPNMQPVRAPGPNAQPANEQMGMLAHTSHTYGFAPGKMLLLTRARWPSG